MEVTSLVLGAFPMIMASMEHGRTFAKVGRLHRRMREEYNNCRSDVKFYQIWYNRNLQNLLHSIVYEQEEVDRLLKDPDGDAWRDDKLQALLEESLWDSYPIYMNIMQRMNETMHSLKTELCVDDTAIQSQLVVAQTTQRPTSSSSLSSTFSKLTVAKSRWDYETFRIKFSFNDTTRRDLFKQLKDCNSRLEKLLLLSNKAPPSQDSGAAATNKQLSRMQTVFRSAHKNSITLYKAIKHSWKCTCQEHHHANLQLEHRTDSDGISFRMIFGSSPLLTPGGPRWKQKELRFKQVSQGCPCSKGQHSHHSPPETLPQPTQRTSVPLLDSPEKASKESPFGMMRQKHKKVTIQDPDPVNPPKHASLPADVQLCERLGNSHEESTCLGTVSHDGKTYHIEPLTETRNDEVTLWDSLSDADGPSRRRRYFTALLLASSVAQLQSTPWLPQGITKRDILFYPFSSDYESQRDLYREPFIRKGFPAGDASKPPPESAASSLFRLLGILLLELCFGQRLEDHPSRIKYTASTAEEKQMFDLVVAMTWAKSVEEEAGHDYAAAVDWCLMGGSKNQQAKDAWRDDIIKNVIVPLGKCQAYLEAASVSPRK